MKKPSIQIGLGIAIGAALAFVMGSQSLWMALGIAIGVAIGISMARHKSNSAGFSPYENRVGWDGRSKRIGGKLDSHLTKIA